MARLFHSSLRVTGRRNDGWYDGDDYASLRSGSPLNQASMPSTIWL